MKNNIICPIALYEGVSPGINMLYGVTLPHAHVCGYIWYIKGPSINILVDAGITADLMERDGFGNKKNVQSLEDGLKKHGLQPDDIKLVIFTHLHHDHTALAHSYTKAKFIVQKQELSFARNPHTTTAYTYRKEYFEDLDFDVIDGDQDIADGIRVILTPGHSPGSQSVAVDTARGTAIITGFCCIRQNFEPPQELRSHTPVITPGIHTDALAAYDSIMRIKKMSQIVIPLHDPFYKNVEQVT